MNRGIFGAVALGLLGLCLGITASFSHAQPKPAPYHAPAQTTCVRQRDMPPNYGKHHSAKPHKAHWVTICRYHPHHAAQGYQGWNHAVNGVGYQPGD